MQMKATAVLRWDCDGLMTHCFATLQWRHYGPHLRRVAGFSGGAGYQPRIDLSGNT